MSDSQQTNVVSIDLRGEIAAAVDGGVTRGHPVAIAYVDENGQPHVSPRGTVQVYSDHQLALWSRSKGLPDALWHNPRVALLYQDLANGTLYRFSGRATVVTDPDIRETVFAHSPDREQAQDPDRTGTAVIIEIESVKGKGPSGVVDMERAPGDAVEHRSPLSAAVSREGLVMTQMLIVSDVERSVAFYRDVLGATVAREDPPAMLRLQNGWLVLNVGGGPTPDKPEVTVTAPEDLNRVSSFLNIRVSDIHTVYNDWSARGAKFLTGPINNHGAELRCYLRDPDGYLIEVGQTLTATRAG